MSNDTTDDVKKVLDSLHDSYRECEAKRKDSEVCEFDLIRAVGGGSINENAHTRILAALLAIRPVRKLFWSVLVRKYPKRGLERLVQSEAEGKKANVCCFENYLDACVTVNGCKVIIENKVKGAIDQPDQIDRYVNIVKSQVVNKEDIFVLYITQSGGSPSAASFNEAKGTLDYKGSSDSGRFFELDYLHDILPFLYELLGRRMELNLAENARESFRGGVIQYVNYIEGSDLLGLRERDDGYGDFRKEVRKILPTKSSLTEFLTYAEWLLLKNRRALEMMSLGNACFDRQDIETKRGILKFRFYSAFGIAVPDDEFYVQVHLGNDAVVSMGMWEDVEASKVQVDVWSDAPNEDYDNAIEVLEKKAHELNHGVMKYNNHDMIRFRIATLDDLTNVINLILNTPEIGKPKNMVVAASMADEIHTADSTVCCNVYPEEMMRQIKLAVNSSRSEMRTSSDSDLWNIVSDDNGHTIDHGYLYHKDWAIQLYENPDDYMRALDVFPKRGVSVGETLRLLVAMANDFPCRVLRWDGRVFCRFPTPTKEYAKGLLSKLWQWREEQRVECQ